MLNFCKEKNYTDAKWSYKCDLNMLTNKILLCLAVASLLWVLHTYGIILLTHLWFCNLGTEYLGEIMLVGCSI